ncbi:MAG: bifunctional oligoribonuclease/PAP phosphatase NrnA [Thermodesulfobacteriota bacterium]
MQNKYADAVKVLKEGKRFIVISHLNPEGDAIGSLLGLVLALRAEGKEAVAYLEDDLPDMFGFLPGSDTIVHSLDGEVAFDATFAVDCGQKERLGKGFNAFSGCGTLVNIDHHVTNDSFGEINVIDGSASSAGEMVYDFIKAADIDIDKRIATNLYVAIHTDTGSFRYSSSTSGAFMKAGDLVACGADPWEVSTHVYENLPFKRFILLGRVLSTMKLVEHDGVKVAMLLVTDEMLKETGATRELSDGFVNYARSVEGVEVGMLFKESDTNGDPYKVSFRSKGKVDVAAIAARFKGGGHKNAAGCTIDGTLEEIKARVFEALKEQIALTEGL